MVLIFAAITLLLFFVIRPLQKNAFYMLYFALMMGTAVYFEMHGMKGTPFSKNILMLFLGAHFVWINSVTFIAYVVDKNAAKKHAWRIPELQLHLLELLGGTPTAFIAQKILRHKTKKTSYRISFVFVLAVQIAIIYYVVKTLHLM